MLVDNSGVCKLADFGSAKKIYTLLEGSMVHSLKGKSFELKKLYKLLTYNRNSELDGT